jgi:transcriptional antiterminator NusG
MADEDTQALADSTEETPAEETVSDEQTHIEEPQIDSTEETEEAADETEATEAPLEAEKAEAPSEEAPVEEAPEEEKAADAEEATEEAVEEEEKPAPAPVVDDSPAAKGRWYVVHTFSGHENRVGATLKQRIESEHLENLIFDILVPTQDKIEIRGGKKETVKEKIFPGYILVKMLLTDESWLAVRTTQGVTSFVGAGNKPTPISEAEVNSIVKFTTQGAMPTFKEVFMVDDTVKIIDGPFADFIGKVDSVDTEKGRLRVLVSIFGRETPVELDFLQVTKL